MVEERADYGTTHFDAVTLKGTVAASELPAELRPAKAIANIPIAKIEPRTAFALSHLSNPCGFLVSEMEI